MNSLAELEKEALRLSVPEREHLALSMWASLKTARGIDPEGVEIASLHDEEIESGKIQTISHSEFLLRTGGKE